MFNFLEGEVLLINKPLQWTSFDVVNKLKWTLKKHLGLKKIKIGHAGTLDPLATGLLIVCTGKKTKTIPRIQDDFKVYSGSIELGSTTPSYDLETEVSFQTKVDHLQKKDLLAAAEALSGEQDQLPPIFSAKKINGKRAYEMARKGQTPEMRSKRITVDHFKLTKIDLPEVAFEIKCSKGTYIRSLAHDFGQELEVGAYLKSLCRTQIGDYLLQDAYELDKLVSDIQGMAAEKPKEIG